MATRLKSNTVAELGVSRSEAPCRRTQSVYAARSQKSAGAAAEMWRELAGDDITPRLDVAAPRIERFLASHEGRRTTGDPTGFCKLSMLFHARQIARRVDRKPSADG